MSIIRCNMKIKSLLLYLTLAVCVLSAYSLNAQLPKEYLQLLVPSESRFVTDLSGNWERSEDMSEWTSVRLPLSEQISNKIIYKRFVKIPADMVDNFSWQIYFLGIDHHIEVFWNEQFIGRFVGAMVPFTVRIPDNAVRQETNEIRFVVMPSESKIRQIRHQHLNSKREFTGIIREVLLVGTPHAWISDLRHNIKVKSENSADILAKISISSSEIKYLINKLKVKDSISLKSKDKITISLSAEIRRKSTGDLLYTSTAKTLIIESERTVIEEIAMSVS